MTESELNDLRERIAAIDRDILNLARERIDCAREIGRVKIDNGRPVRDFSTERVVLERTRDTCRELGLPFELGEGVLMVLIDEAVRVQEELRERVPRSAPQRALVVGGGGGMGGWLCSYLEAQGHAVKVLDPAGAPDDFPRARSLASAWGESDVVALSVPLEAGPTILDEIADLPPGPLVFDVFSLKTFVADRLRALLEAGHKVASIHPMFGPTARLLSGRALVICDTGHAEAMSQVRRLFEATSLDIVEIPLAEHDRRMSDMLGLSHAVSLVFARALAASPLSLEELAETASTTFQKQAATSAEVVSENPELYYQIQKLNPHTGEALGRFAEALEALRREIAEERRSDFVREMEKARKRLMDV